MVLGKIIGAALGGLVGGPVGAGIGAALGHAFDSDDDSSNTNAQTNTNTQTQKNISTPQHGTALGDSWDVDGIRFLKPGPALVLQGKISGGTANDSAVTVRMRKRSDGSYIKSAHESYRDKDGDWVDHAWIDFENPIGQDRYGKVYNVYLVIPFVSLPENVPTSIELEIAAVRQLTNGDIAISHGMMVDYDLPVLFDRNFKHVLGATIFAAIGVANCDGPLNGQEVKKLREVLTSLTSLDDDAGQASLRNMMNAAQQYYQKSTPQSYAQEAARLLRPYCEDDETAINTMKILHRICIADLSDTEIERNLENGDGPVYLAVLPRTERAYLEALRRDCGIDADVWEVLSDDDDDEEQAQQAQQAQIRLAGYFEALELDTSASWSDVKVAYRKLIVEYHPDKLHGVSPRIRQLAESRLKEITEAYAALEKHFGM